MKNKNINFRISDLQYQQLQDIASFYDDSLSGAIRQLISIKWHEIDKLTDGLLTYKQKERRLKCDPKRL